MEINFCDNLKQLRLQNKMSQTNLANAINTTVKTISHWETGYTEPSLIQLCALAEVFNITLDELVK